MICTYAQYILHLLPIYCTIVLSNSFILDTHPVSLLYMTNYYIVAPTCGQYAARVGSTEAMAGIVIGMTPNAALIATILYGWWSNHSYKSALLFAATCSVLGNIAYGLALSYDSIHLVMIGRFLNGFGSARSINRKWALIFVHMLAI